MRENILCYINGERIEIKGESAFMTVAQYLRYQKGLTGTKIVCSEGDCGACTVLVSRMVSGEMTPYKSINSCISFMYLLDKCHLVTVEGLGTVEHLHPVQEEMVKCHGSQCGYCTPGFICAMANMTEDLKITGKKNTTKKVKNYLTGNLCRCTGYEPIVKAGESVNLDEVILLSHQYKTQEIKEDFIENANSSLILTFGDQEVFLPSKFREVIKYKEANKYSKLASGATDLGVLHNKGRIELNKILCLNNLGEAYKVNQTADSLEIGAKASLDDVEKACEKIFPEFSRKLHVFASPQIKNKGTLVGNLVNASPIGDSIPFLKVAEANIVLASTAGVRILNINDFFLGGYKEIDLKPNEIVFKISLPKTDHQFKLYKVSLRKDLDISSVTFACRYKVVNSIIEDISFAFGGVGPVVIRATDLEIKAKRQKFSKVLFSELAKEVKSYITPMSDLRGSKEFRELIAHNLLLKFYDEVSNEMGIGTSEASL